MIWGTGEFEKTFCILFLEYSVEECGYIVMIWSFDLIKYLFCKELDLWNMKAMYLRKNSSRNLKFNCTSRSDSKKFWIKPTWLSKSIIFLIHTVLSFPLLIWYPPPWINPYWCTQSSLFWMIRTFSPPFVLPNYKSFIVLHSFISIIDLRANLWPAEWMDFTLSPIPVRNPFEASQFNMPHQLV